MVPVSRVVLGLAIVSMAACGDRHADRADAGATVPDSPRPIDANGPYADFPAQPIIDNSGSGAMTPTNAPTLFGPPGTGSATNGPCLEEPEIGALLPLAGLRPRFNVIPNGTQNLFEIRLHNANEINDLVVYTNNPIWALPTAMWQDINQHIVDQPIDITIRAATTDGTTLTSPVTIGPSGPITIAPVPASGAIVYWTPSAGTPPEGTLKGFSYGDETVTTVLTPAQGSATCVGCHSSTPDGDYVAFSARGDGASDTQISLRSVDGNATPAPFITASAQTLLARTEQELPMFSTAHWTTGDHVTVTLSPSLGTGLWDLYWTDLEANSTAEGVGWGLLARTGDSNSASGATFSHDGKRITYTSESNPSAGVLPIEGQLETIPYNDRAGGSATPIPGASDPTLNQFFPAYSPDDQLLAFTRYPVDGSQAYSNPLSEVFAIPATGGTAVRLAANDPPVCTGVVSPGITNSWPKWAPEAQVVGTKTYYWMAFSSSRLSSGTLQLYVTAVVVEGGVITTYPSFYLWNQPAAESNHTPAWDVFQIP